MGNFDDVFSFVMDGYWGGGGRRNRGYYAFDSEVKTLESGDREITLELPGVKREDLKVEWDGDILVVKGKRGKREFERSFILSPRRTDLDKMEAKLEDGILTISLPKKETTREIKVR